MTAKDTVQIGSTSQPGQIIGLANSESAGIASDRFMDGILGLSFPSLSYTGETTSIVESMYDAGQIDEPVVGIYLGRISDAGGKGEAVSRFFFLLRPNSIDSIFLGVMCMRICLGFWWGES